MEALLPACLNSIDINDDRLEVLVVNDGSTDNSLKIANLYAAKNPSVFKVIDKENGNYGSCINAALPIAKGKYVKVLDADDRFDTSEFTAFVHTLQEANSDMVVTAYRTILATGKTIYHDVSLFPKGAQPTDAFFRNRRFNFLPMHRIAYKTKFLKEIGYKQTEGISYTDSEWTFKPLFHIKSAATYGLCVYEYHLGRQGQTMNPANLLKSLKQEIVILQGLIDYKLKYNSTTCSEVNEFIDFTLLRKVILIYTQELIIAPDKAFDSNIVKEMEQILKDKDPSLYNAAANFDCRSFVIRHWRKHQRRLPFLIRNSAKLTLNAIKLLKHNE